MISYHMTYKVLFSYNFIAASFPDEPMICALFYLFFLGRQHTLLLSGTTMSSLLLPELIDACKCTNAIKRTFRRSQHLESRQQHSSSTLH